jgi:UDP-N-acetylmuramoylalanine--D-glutamate ligase
MTRALVYGLAVAGASTVRALQRRGIDVIVADDHVDEHRRAEAGALDVELVAAPDDRLLRDLVASCELIVPSPGVPESHPVISAARSGGKDLVSEIELAYRFEQDRRGGPRPMLAVTGTDGKTTTTLLTVAMLERAGKRSVDAGNTDTPLVDAIEEHLDVFVVECTSFRLAWTPTFRAEAAVWLNLAPDHLNWHRSMSTYEAAKARVFANQRSTDAAIGFADDAIVMRWVGRASARRRSFGLDRGDYRVVDGCLAGPHGTIAPIASLRRALPHDITNSLAASALVLESGLADASAIESALAGFVGPPHRLELIADIDDVQWYNDSKATTPHAAAAAISSFDRVVLIAGGYDKGVDLTSMATGLDRVRAVVGFGATARSVQHAFSGVPTAVVVESLDDAVARAASLAEPGDVVLLSPGCASFDQYDGFEQRGDHFRDLVARLEPSARLAAVRHGRQPDRQPERRGS